MKNVNNLLNSILKYTNNVISRRTIFSILRLYCISFFFIFLRRFFYHFVLTSYFVYLYYSYTQYNVYVDNIDFFYYSYYNMDTDFYDLSGFKFFSLSHFNFYLYESYDNFDIYKVFPNPEFASTYYGYFCSYCINSYFPVFHGIEYSLLFYSDVQLLLNRLDYSVYVDRCTSHLTLLSFIERQYLYNEVGKIYLHYLIECEQLPGQLNTDKIIDLIYHFNTSYKYKFLISFVRTVYRYNV